MNKQLTVEHNDFFIISIQLHVSASRGHRQTRVGSFLKRTCKLHLLEMRCHFLHDIVITSEFIFHTFNKFLNSRKNMYVHPWATKDIVNIFFEIMVKTFTFNF